ncbi:MAG: GTP cyclohydrolase I [Sulfobacillus sp.]
MADRHIDQKRAERAVLELLAALGLDREPTMAETPVLVAEALAELCAGLETSPPHLALMAGPDGPVALDGLRFFSLCEHHLLPFFGVARVTYLPAGQLAGIGDIARLVDNLARRPTIQERLTDALARRLMDDLQAKGVAVRLEATHLCVAMRGAKQSESRLITECRLGELGQWGGWPK